MRNGLRFIIIGILVIAGWSPQAISAEYYVTESRSGIISIIDHKPQGGATILKGPFETQKAAEEALTSEEREKLDTRGKGKGRGKCGGKGQGQGQGRGQGRNR